MTLTEEQKKERQHCEMIGMLRSKVGIVQYYTSILGMDIEEATPKIEAECKWRNIPLESEPPEPKKDVWGKVESAFEKGTMLAGKYPIIAEIGKPLFKAFLAGATTTIVGVITGNKLAKSNDDNDEIEEEVNGEVIELELDKVEEEKPIEEK